MAGVVLTPLLNFCWVKRHFLIASLTAFVCFNCVLFLFIKIKLRELEIPYRQSVLRFQESQWLENPFEQ